MSDTDLRVQQLFDIHLITQLKHIYLNACDQKDPDTMKSVFTNPCEIDYGQVGSFNNPNDLAEIFKAVGCHDYMKESHHAHNPIINFLDNESAEGTWGLTYTLINTNDQTHTVLQGMYEDEYKKINDQWKISKTTFKPSSQIQLDISEEILKVLLVG